MEMDRLIYRQDDTILAETTIIMRLLRLSFYTLVTLERNHAAIDIEWPNV